MDSTTEISGKQVLELLFKNSELIEQTKRVRILELELLKSRKLVESLQKSNDDNKHTYIALYDAEMRQSTQLLQRCTALQNQYDQAVNSAMIEKQTLNIKLRELQQEVGTIRKENEKHKARRKTSAKKATANNTTNNEKFVEMEKDYKILQRKYGANQDQLDEVLEKYEQCRSELLAEKQKIQKLTEDFNRKLKELEDESYEKTKLIEELNKKNETWSSSEDTLSLNRSLEAISMDLLDDTSSDNLAVSLAVKPASEEPSDDCIETILAEMIHVRSVVTPLPCTEPASPPNNEDEELINVCCLADMPRATSAPLLGSETLLWRRMQCEIQKIKLYVLEHCRPVKSKSLHKKMLMRRILKRRLRREALRLSMPYASGESTDASLVSTDAGLGDRSNVPDNPSGLTPPIACDKKPPPTCYSKLPTLPDPTTSHCEKPSEAALEIVPSEKLPKSNEIVHRKTLVQRPVQKMTKKRLHKESSIRLSKLPRLACPTPSSTGCISSESVDTGLEGRLDASNKPSELALPVFSNEDLSPTLPHPAMSACEEPSKAALDSIPVKKLPKNGNNREAQAQRYVQKILKERVRQESLKRLSKLPQLMFSTLSSETCMSSKLAGADLKTRVDACIKPSEDILPVVPDKESPASPEPAVPPCKESIEATQKVIPLDKLDNSLKTPYGKTFALCPIKKSLNKSLDEEPISMLSQLPTLKHPTLLSPACVSSKPADAALEKRFDARSDLTLPVISDELPQFNLESPASPDPTVPSCDEPTEIVQKVIPLEKLCNSASQLGCSPLLTKACTSSESTERTFDPPAKPSEPIPHKQSYNSESPNPVKLLYEEPNRAIQKIIPLKKFSENAPQLTHTPLLVKACASNDSAETELKAPEKPSEHALPVVPDEEVLCNLESPALPKLVAPQCKKLSKAAPKIIPLEKLPKSDIIEAKLKLAVHFPRVAAIAQYLVSLFLQRDPHFTARCVLKLVASDVYSKAEVRARGAPPLTLTQATMLGFLIQLEQNGLTSIMDIVLIQAEQLIMKQKSLKTLISIARLHAAICQLRLDYTSMRLTMSKALAIKGDVAIPYLYTVISGWTNLIPHYDTNIVFGDTALEMRTLVHVIQLSRCTIEEYNLKNLMTLLCKNRGYPYDREDSKVLLKDLFKYYIAKRTDTGTYLTVALCRSLSMQVVFPQVENVKMELHLTDSVDKICAVIRLVGLIVPLFCGNPKAAASIDSNKKWLLQFCTDGQAEEVRELALCMVQD